MDKREIIIKQYWKTARIRKLYLRERLQIYKERRHTNSVICTYHFFLCLIFSHMFLFFLFSSHFPLFHFLFSHISDLLFLPVFTAVTSMAPSFSFSLFTFFPPFLQLTQQLGPASYQEREFQFSRQVFLSLSALKLESFYGVTNNK